LIIYSSSYSFTGFLIAEIVMAIATAMWKASGNSFFYDTLRELDKEGGEYTRYKERVEELKEERKMREKAKKLHKKLNF